MKTQSCHDANFILLMTTEVTLQCVTGDKKVGIMRTSHLHRFSTHDQYTSACLFISLSLGFNDNALFSFYINPLCFEIRYHKIWSEWSIFSFMFMMPLWGTLSILNLCLLSYPLETKRFCDGQHLLSVRLSIYPYACGPTMTLMHHGL